MLDVLTVTLNPALDLSTSAAHVVPTHKIRCESLQRHPGGGGVNVARVIHRLGGQCTALYPAGGANGAVFQQLLDEEGVPSLCIPIAGETRENFSVKDIAINDEFRFVLPGPALQTREWQACMDQIIALDNLPRFVVASGSLPPGVPFDFYARLSRLLKPCHVQLMLDTSGPALSLALDEGVYMCKPSLRELSELCGQSLGTEADWRLAAQELIRLGKAEVIVLSLGEGGACLFTGSASWFAPALPVHVVSAIGAGDSFVGVMVWAMSKGFDLPDAFKYGVAGATAALMSTGTGLCQPGDVNRLFEDVRMVKI
jgi:6-phosphofructokinase 2